MDNVVLGLGFGDEGKGLVTDWLASKAKSPIVCRFSGGHQSGHTVVKDGIRHVFASFGSGTLRGAPTYWAPTCTVEAAALLNELRVLLNKGISPRIAIDARCPVTTPWDIRHNRTYGKENGTVGVGFGSTIAREEAHYHFQFGDIYHPRVARMKIAEIVEHYYKDHIENGTLDHYMNILTDIVLAKPYVKWCRENQNLGGDTIYEGSQGLLLDQHYGFFPHVTRANTGTKNISDVINDDTQFYLVTRAYQTRHGNGPMSNEDILYIKDDPRETNVQHAFQGTFRRGLLDLDLIHYAIASDPILRRGVNINLVITCMDHMKEFMFIEDGKLVGCTDGMAFAKRVAATIGIDDRCVYMNDSPESKTIRRVYEEEN